MRRHSFLLHVHPGEVSTLENLRTRERVRIDHLDAVGAQIERWVSEAATDGGEPAEVAEDVGADDPPGRAARLKGASPPAD